MENSKFPKEFKLYLPLIILFTVLLILLPKAPKFSYEYSKGSPWLHDNLVAAFDFPVLKTEEQLQAERDSLGQRKTHYFRYSDAARASVESALSSLDLGANDSLRNFINSEISAIYSKGVLPNLTEGESNSEDRLIFVQKNKQTQKLSTSELYTEKGAQNRLRSALTKTYPKVNVDSLLSATNLLLAVSADLIYDEELTNLMHQNSSDFVSPTQGVISHGTVLVQRGETVTAETKQILDSYAKEYNKSVGYDGNIGVLWLGTALIALVIVALFFLSILYGNRKLLDKENYRRYLYLMTIFLLSAVLTLAMDKYAPDYIMMVPYSLIAMYLLAFFRKKIVMPAYIISLLPLLLSAQNGSEMFLMHLFAGMVCMYSFTYLNHGWKQFLNSIIIFNATLLVWLGLKMCQGDLFPFEWRSVLMLAFAAFFCVLGYPLINLFEVCFNLVSSQRLTDLCDTNSNALLRELQEKAPGTFQHSLQVANLAEHAARSISCDVLLVRAGALYHDIGKINNPMCFVENQPEGRGTYHDGKTPLESATDIIKHVSDGMELAKKHKLPQEVRQFIITHHGTTSASFFLSKYKNSENPDPAMYQEFYYKGVKPKTKEQTIVMICDSIEAASRTLMDFTPASVDAFVEAMFRGKQSDGTEKGDQFEDSEITMAEFKLIKKAIKEYLIQLHHARISYPDQPHPQPKEPKEEKETQKQPQQKPKRKKRFIF